jgi:hypothetical protein
VSPECAAGRPSPRATCRQWRQTPDPCPRHGKRQTPSTKSETKGKRQNSNDRNGRRSRDAERPFRNSVIPRSRFVSRSAIRLCRFRLNPPGLGFTAAPVATASERYRRLVERAAVKATAAQADRRRAPAQRPPERRLAFGQRCHRHGGRCYQLLSPAQMEEFRPTMPPARRPVLPNSLPRTNGGVSANDVGQTVSLPYNLPTRGESGSTSAYPAPVGKLEK